MIYRAEELRRETTQLTHDNTELSAQLESAQCRLMELTIELGQLRDDVTRLKDQLQLKDLENGIVNHVHYINLGLITEKTAYHIGADSIGEMGAVASKQLWGQCPQVSPQVPPSLPTGILSLCFVP